MSPSTTEPAAERYVSDVEAARILGLSKSYLKHLRGHGGGPRYAKIAERVVRYRVSELHAWASTKMVASTSEQAA